jgi:hypothetical protein
LTQDGSDDGILRDCEDESAFSGDKRILFLPSFYVLLHISMMKGSNVNVRIRKAMVLNAV